MTAKIDILIPTYNRPAALAVTLTSLAYQSYSNYRVLISDQSDQDVAHIEFVRAAVRFLQLRGVVVEILKNLPRRGMAEQRQFLLTQARAPYVLYLDDDVMLEPFVIANLLQALETAGCGFMGNAVIGLSFLEDFRPHEQTIEFWDGPVQPEILEPNTPAWERYRLHNAANLYHVQNQLGISPAHPRLYRVAWVGGCVLYAADKLRAVGGFSFWRELPEQHSGEDVLAQWRVMARYGGAGLLPSGVYHQELPTTIPNRQVDAPRTLGLFPAQTPGAAIFEGGSHEPGRF